MHRNRRRVLNDHGSLNVLPDDVLLEVFSHLNAEDVLALSRVSSVYRNLSNSFIVWHNVLLRLLDRARYIDLLALDQKPLKDVAISELKRSIVMASRAENNWLSDRPKKTSEGRVVENIEQRLDHVLSIIKFTSKHLIVPLSGGLLGWNMEENCPAGTHEMDNDSILTDIAPDTSSRSLFCLFSKIESDRFGDNARLSVLRIKIPEPGSTHPLLFENVARMTLSAPSIDEIHLLDVSRRMLCVAFSYPTTKTMGILLVRDWDKQESAMFDTGLIYSYGKSPLTMRLSDDADCLIIVSEDQGSEFRRWYRLTELGFSTSDWNTLNFKPVGVLAPVKREAFKWERESKFLAEPNTSPCLFWHLDQTPPHSYAGIPLRTSTVILYITVPEGNPDPNRRIWRVMQYYSDRNGPCSPTRSVVTLTRPAVSPYDADGDPILCISFNHLGWIEDFESGEGRKRVLKLVTLPDPGTYFEDDLTGTARTLDIPSDVLADACHVLLDATQGLIVVATLSNGVRTYYY